MDFQNVKLLTYEHKNNFWGDKSFRYSSTVSMSIKGYILNLSNTYGVKDIFTACKTLSDSLNSYSDILINGQNYGRAKITGVTFDSGNWVKVTEYTASIEIIQEGSIFDFAGKEFDGGIISSIKGGARFLEDFSESYSADYSSNEDSISGSHSIDIKMSTLYSGNKIDFAKNLASVLFSKTFIEKLSEITYSKPSESLRKDYYSENYNTITGACGFKRNFSYSNASDCFSRKRSVTINFGEDGITNATESNSIQGECLSSTLFDSAETGFASEISGAFARCQSVFATYQTQFGIVNPLINKELERSVKRNKFTGEIEYSVIFTNDKRRKNLYTYEYTLDLSRSEDFIWSAVESGSIKGDGVIGSDDKFNQALTGWSTENSGITARVTSFYTTNAKIKPSPSSLKFITKNITYQPFEGVVSYSWSYTDDTTLDMSSEIRRKSIEINDSKATRIHNDFLIPGGVVVYSIAQAASQSKQGERDVKGNLEITSSAVPFVGNNYFNNCVTLAASNKGTGADLYLEGFSFSSDEIEQNVEFSAKYKYSEAASSS
jgi:hypothetical protein